MAFYQTNLGGSGGTGAFKSLWCILGAVTTGEFPDGTYVQITMPYTDPDGYVNFTLSSSQTVGKILKPCKIAVCYASNNKTYNFVKEYTSSDTFPATIPTHGSTYALVIL